MSGVGVNAVLPWMPGADPLADRAALATVGGPPPCRVPFTPSDRDADDPMSAGPGEHLLAVADE